MKRTKTVPPSYVGPDGYMVKDYSMQNSLSMESKNVEKKSYSVRVFCSNCGHDGVVSIPKGSYIQEKPCPNCGCDSLMRGTPVPSLKC